MVQELYKKSNGLVLAMLEKIWWSPRERFLSIRVAKIPSKERRNRDFLLEIGEVWSTRKIGKPLFSNPLTFMMNLELINKFIISQPKIVSLQMVAKWVLRKKRRNFFRSTQYDKRFRFFFIIDLVESLKGRFRAILLFEFFRWLSADNFQQIWQILGLWNESFGREQIFVTLQKSFLYQLLSEHRQRPWNIN